MVIGVGTNFQFDYFRIETNAQVTGIRNFKVVSQRHELKPKWAKLSICKIKEESIRFTFQFIVSKQIQNDKH